MHKGMYIVAVYRTKIPYIQSFEEVAFARKKAFGCKRHLFEYGFVPCIGIGIATHEVPYFVFQTVIGSGRSYLGQIATQCTDLFIYGNTVVIQNNQNIGIGTSCMIQSLESQTSRHRAVSYDGYMMIVPAVQPVCNRHCQGRRYGSRSMTCPERIVFTFISPWKTAQTVQFSDILKLVSSSCKHFMRVSLMTYVPNKAVIRNIIKIMQSHGQLNRAET